MLRWQPCCFLQCCRTICGILIGDSSAECVCMTGSVHSAHRQCCIIWCFTTPRPVGLHLFVSSGSGSLNKAVRHSENWFWHWNRFICTLEKQKSPNSRPDRGIPITNGTQIILWRIYVYDYHHGESSLLWVPPTIFQGLCFKGYRSALSARRSSWSETRHFKATPPLETWTWKTTPTKHERNIRRNNRINPKSGRNGSMKMIKLRNPYLNKTIEHPWTLLETCGNW